MITTEPPADTGIERSRGERSRGVAVAAVIAILAIAAALAGVAFYGYRAYEVYAVHEPTQTARDEAVAGAEQAILNVTTVDPKNTAAWKRRVDASLTGKAREQITAQDVSTLNQQITQAGSQAAALTSRLKRSAPTEVDADAGTAKVLVYVDATAKRDGQAGVTQTMGFSVTMTKVGGQWKASDISPLDGISVDSSGQTAQNSSQTSGGN
ncbi:MAG: hypothetical protein QM673_11285 [Gordonia sp. (in: high G+C Gram-positive bacteria)]